MRFKINIIKEIHITNLYSEEETEMGLFGMLKNATSEAIANQKEKMDKAYEDTMRRTPHGGSTQVDSYGLENALQEYEKYLKRGENLSAMGCIRAIRMLCNEASDDTLRRCYDHILEKNSYKQLNALQSILSSRGLLEKDGETYKKTW